MNLPRSCHKSLAKPGLSLTVLNSQLTEFSARSRHGGGGGEGPVK